VGKKYTFSEKNYFSISFDEIQKSNKLSFPLFIYFQNNDHLILRYQSNKDINIEEFEKYKEKGLKEFWCPKEFYEDYKNSEIRTDANAESIMDPTTELAIATLESDSLSENEKEKILSKIGQDYIEVIAGMGGNDPEEAKKSLNKCNAFVDEIIKIAGASHEMGSLFEDISMIKKIDLPHSASCSTFSVIFSMALGHTDPKSLADIAFASLLHDIGFMRIDFSILQKSIDTFSPKEGEAFKEHVNYVEEIFKLHQIEITPSVSEIIQDHHEQFDGNGYPIGKMGFQINEMSQILSLADYLDELLDGKHNGEKLTPAEGFEVLKKMQLQPDPQRRFNPEVFDPIVQAASRSNIKRDESQLSEKDILKKTG